MQLPIFEKYIDELIEKSTLDVPAWNIEKAREGKAAGWNYIDGCMILALLEIYSATGEKKYYEFADAFIDHRVQEDGTITKYSVEEYNIDNVNAGKTLFALYALNGKEKYRKAIDLIYSQVETQPRTEEGNFWHKKIYPNQVWLDGMYMGQPFYMEYDAFMEPVTWFLTGMEKHSDERRTDLWGNADNFIGAMRHFMASMLTPSLQVAMNELSNHDHSRFLTRTNHKVGRVSQHGTKGAEEGVNLAVMREAVVMQMTWVGAPTVYYGDEVGLCGFTDPDNRRTYPWGHEDQELLAFHKEMIRIHKTEKPLRKGSIKLLAAGKNLLACSLR